MDLQEVRNKAREKMKGCHVCPQCNGKACIGMIPGFGGLRTGRSFMRNVEALQEYGLVMRSMSGVDDPDTTRSDERREGKESRSRGKPYHKKKEKLMDI